MPHLPYKEPGISTLLSLTSLLLLLNGFRYILDRFLYCGIIGEILIGVVWGLPVGGRAWLTLGMQETIQALGYLGLIGLVFEGGISTDLALLKKTAYISITVATIGLCLPIALSFILLAFPFPTSSGTAYPSSLAAFSAGASLCSTSLGTTFAILSSAGLMQSKVGTVLIGAAMMDDVVGLIMVNIVTTLGEGGTGGWSIARPIVASFGLLLVTLSLCSYVLKRVWLWMPLYLRAGNPTLTTDPPKGTVQRLSARLVGHVPHLGFTLSTTVLIIFVTIAYSINASVLFAAFIAGGVVSFLWNAQTKSQEEESIADGPSMMYEKYFKSIMDLVLVPFFFASIGFSIPITQMFKGSIVWKGMVYSILMVIAKGLVCIAIYFDYFKQTLSMKAQSFPLRKKSIPLQPPSAPSEKIQPQERTVITPPHTIALLVGLAMTARGEIGFLIASLSQSSGTLTLRSADDLSQESTDEIFLVIIWAVVICTIAGPLGVGLIVRRLKTSTKSNAGWI